MALVKCPDCGRSVSDLAPTCPGCGRPLIENAPVTIEQTRKRYKGYMVLFVITGIVGFFLSGISPILGPAVILASIVMFLGMVFIAWWNHG